MALVWFIYVCFLFGICLHCSCTSNKLIGEILNDHVIRLLLLLLDISLWFLLLFSDIGQIPSHTHTYGRMAFVACVEIEITSLFGRNSLKVSEELTTGKKRAVNIMKHTHNGTIHIAFLQIGATKVMSGWVSYGRNNAEIWCNAFNINEDSIGEHVCTRGRLACLSFYPFLCAMSKKLFFSVNYLLFGTAHA